MLDAATAYPLLKRRRRRWSPRPHQLRIAAVLALCGALVIGAALWLTRAETPDARASLAATLHALATGNYHAARTHAQAATVADPQAGAAYAALARAHLELENGVAAEGALARAAAAGVPRGGTDHLLAHARLLQNDPAGALAAAARATAPHRAYAARIAARALALSGRNVAARRALEAVVAADPRDARAWTDLGRLRMALGDLGGASQAAGTAARLSPGEPHALTLQGEVVRARYGPVAALPWFEAALKRDAHHYPALIQYAATLGEAGRNVDMLAAVRRASESRPARREPLYLQPVLAARAGRLDLASALLERAPPGPGAALLGGAVDYAAGRWEQAVAKWRDLLDAQPMNLTARRLLAAALLRSGDARAALATLRPLALRGDADTYALTLTARASEALGDRAEAARFLDRAASGARGPAAAFATDRGFSALAAGAAESPTDPTYAVGLIRGLFATGDTAGAVARAAALAAASPGAPAAQVAQGDALALAGRDPTAAYARAADLRFDEPTMLRLADAQARAGRTREAATTLALYLGQNPQSLVGQRMLGRLQLAAGEWDAAIETLESVRARIGHGEAALLADLGIAYAGDEEGEIAVRYARAAYALQPMSAAVCDAYGTALAAAGRIGEARQLLDKAVALAPGDRVIAGHRRQIG